MDDEDMTELDRNIMRYVGVKTPRAIAEMTGHTAEEVLRRKDDLLNEIDMLTVEQKIVKLMISLEEIAEDAKVAAGQADYRDKGPLYSAAVAAIDKQLRQLGLIQKQNDGAVAELNQKRLQEILRLMDKVVAKGIAEVSTVYDISEDDLAEIFHGNLVEAAREVEA